MCEMSFLCLLHGQHHIMLIVITIDSCFLKLLEKERNDCLNNEDLLITSWKLVLQVGHG